MKHKKAGLQVLRGSGLQSLLVGIVAAVSLTRAMPAKATIINTIDFHDLTDNTLVQPTYQGFNWSGNWEVVSNSRYQGDYGNSYGAPFSPNAVTNHCAVDGLDPNGINYMTVASDTLFNFVGASFTGFADHNGVWSQPIYDDVTGEETGSTNYTSSTITVTGYHSDGSVESAKIPALSTTGYDFLNANFANVNRLTFQTDQPGTQWLMSNFQFSTAPVPEPSTYVMMGLGIIALGVVGQRKKKSAALVVA